MLVLDTSALFALVDRGDPDHKRTAHLLAENAGPYLVPAAILAEIGYLMEHRLGTDALRAFLDDIESRAFTLDCGDDDVGRMSALVDRYRDLPLGLANAAVVACAERTGAPVLTLDSDFAVVAREGNFTLAPQEIQQPGTR